MKPAERKSYIELAMCLLVLCGVCVIVGFVINSPMVYLPAMIGCALNISWLCDLKANEN